MSYTIFDCTQLITVSTQEQNSIENIKREFEELGFNVYANKQIEVNKLNYFKDLLNNKVIELVDKEFVGEFEDWKDVSNPPIKIKKFIEKLESIQRIIILMI
jgi:hypothetical protein